MSARSSRGLLLAITLSAAAFGAACGRLETSKAEPTSASASANAGAAAKATASAAASASAGGDLAGIAAGASAALNATATQAPTPTPSPSPKPTLGTPSKKDCNPSCLYNGRCAILVEGNDTRPCCMPITRSVDGPAGVAECRKVLGN